MHETCQCVLTSWAVNFSIDKEKLIIAVYSCVDLGLDLRLQSKDLILTCDFVPHLDVYYTTKKQDILIVTYITWIMQAFVLFNLLTDRRL